MGYRVHACTAYKVEYGDGQCNWKTDEFYGDLTTLDCDPTGEDEYATEYECDLEAFKKAIDRLKKIAAKKKPSKKDLELLDELNTPLNELLETMEYFYDTADKDNDYIHFSVF